MRVAQAPFHKCESQIAESRWPSGAASLDAALAGGFACGRVHEVYAAEADDAAAAAGFVAALASGMSEDRRRPLLWLRTRRDAGRTGTLQANGWAELGGRPERCLFGLVADEKMLLRAAVDALRSAAPGAVVIEGWGKMSGLDLTASRRLVLAAEKSGVPLFVLRIDACPSSSAAQTRWQVSAAPSRALPGHAPGRPVFAIELLRQRSGPAGLAWKLEWNRDQRMFREASLSGAVVPVPAGGAAADSRAGTIRPVIGRRAA
ncbi:hypothetical protein RXV95_07625 [Novosphingobium sp. ZN18A2]|uniref:ImuA family protein n=1 Tax=Novosphingobium sp. ZN18A2 TaxID=3079861 RepID=UPI0030CCCFEC